MLTDRQTDRHTERQKLYTPIAYFVCRGYNDVATVQSIVQQDSRYTVEEM